MLALAAIAVEAYGSYMEGAAGEARGIQIKGQDELLAQQYIKQGADETNYLDRVSQARLGRNLTSAASSNVDATQGSPLLVMADQLRQDKQNEAITLSNAQHKALAAKAAGEQGLLAGEAQGQAGQVNAAGSILGGLGRMASARSRGDGGDAFNTDYQAG